MSTNVKGRKKDSYKLSSSLGNWKVLLVRQKIQIQIVFSLNLCKNLKCKFMYAAFLFLGFQKYIVKTLFIEHVF